LNDQLKVESDRDAEISVERQRRMTAELQNGRDAARIRDLEARLERQRPVIEAAWSAMDMTQEDAYLTVKTALRALDPERAERDGDGGEGEG
jgi:hypothetical protein